ncbi:putative protein recA [Streptomyces sp. Tu6071]|nr:putative protein recA [Streptomyces sp. Tu6071]
MSSPRDGPSVTAARRDVPSWRFRQPAHPHLRPAPPRDRPPPGGTARPVTSASRFRPLHPVRELLQFLPLRLQRLPYDPQSQALRVSLAGEHPREPAQALVTVESACRPQLPVDEFAGGRLLPLGVELPHRLVDEAALDALGPQLPRQGAAGESPAVVPGLDPGPGESGVVDEADLLEARKHLFGRLLGDLPLAQCLGELLAGARRSGEEAQADRPCLLHRVLGLLLPASAPGGGGPCRWWPPSLRTVVVPVPREGGRVVAASCHGSALGGCGLGSLGRLGHRRSGHGLGAGRGLGRLLGRGRLALGLLGLLRLHADAELLLDLPLDLVREVGVVLEEVAGVLLALAELVALVRVPGAGLADEAVLDAHVDEPALTADALPVEDVELGLLERRGDLVLHDLAAGPVAHRVRAVLEGLDAADVDAHRGVELQRPATRGGLGGAEHHTDLLAELVDEDRGRLRLVERAGDLAERLAHEAGLEADVRVAHLALDLGARHEGRHRVDDDEVEGAGADQHVHDLQGLFAVVRLGEDQVVDVDAELPRVLRVERVLRVDEGDGAAGLLRVGHRVQRQRGLAGGLRAVHLHDATARNAADAESDVERRRARGDHLDGFVGPLAHAHDGALAELPLNLCECGVERLLAVRACHGFHPICLSRSLHVEDATACH